MDGVKHTVHVTKSNEIKGEQLPGESHVQSTPITISHLKTEIVIMSENGFLLANHRDAAAVMKWDEDRTFQYS